MLLLVERAADVVHQRRRVKDGTCPHIHAGACQTVRSQTVIELKRQPGDPLRMGVIGIEIGSPSTQPVYAG